MRIISLESIDSTNNYLKRIKSEEDLVVTADVQTGGRGSKGRSFSSSAGGIYVSSLRHFPCKTKDSFSIMENAAMAVVRTLETFGIDAGIKWPNDIMVNGKKICGILIENTFEGDMVSTSIVGIGLNVNNDLPEELANTAVSMKQLLGKSQDKKIIRDKLIENMFCSYSWQEYVENSIVLGKKILVKAQEKTYEAIAKDILSNGNLLLEGGSQLSAAEVSIL